MTAAAVLLLSAPLLAGCRAGAAAAIAPDAPAAASRPMPQRSAPFALVGDTPSGRIAVRAAAGTERVLRLRLANGGAATRVFALRARGPWLAMPATVAVRARESAAVPVTLRVPSGTAPRVHHLSVVASPLDVAQAALALRYESRAPVRVTVTARGTR